MCRSSASRVSKTIDFDFYKTPLFCFQAIASEGTQEKIGSKKFHWRASEKCDSCQNEFGQEQGLDHSFISRVSLQSICLRNKILKKKKSAILRSVGVAC